MHQFKPLFLRSGGGNGQFADALLESGAHKNVRVCIVDIAEEIGSLVAESRKSNLKIFPKTNINELPSEVMFQIVTIMDVIHHVQHSEVTEFLEVAFSKLESGGKMFIKDIEADTFTSYCAWLADTFISSDKPKKFWKSKDLISLVVNLSRQKIHNVNLQRLDKGNFLLTITKIQGSGFDYNRFQYFRMFIVLEIRGRILTLAISAKKKKSWSFSLWENQL